MGPTKGIYQEVFETSEAMDAAISAMANKLLSYHPAALHDLKTVFGNPNWDQLLAERAAISGRLLLSDFPECH